MRADELQRKLQADPAWVAMMEEKSRRAAERGAILVQDSRPLVEDLASVGFQVETVWDLINSPTKYTSAIPILLEHLRRPYLDRNIEGIARALAVKEAAFAFQQFKDLYCGTSNERDGVKQGLACALAATVSNSTLPDLISILKDKSQGQSRGLLLSAIRTSKLPIAVEAWSDLENDPDLRKEIAYQNHQRELRERRKKAKSRVP